MNSPVDDSEFPNTTTDAGETCQAVVGTWKYHVAISYGSMDEMHRTQVTELWWYKSVEGLEHEYVVATCHRDGEINDIILRLERRPSGSDKSLVVPENVLPDGTVAGLSSDQQRSLKTDVETERRILKKSHWTTTLQKTTAKKGNLKNLDSVDTVTRLPGPESFLGEKERLLWHYHSFPSEKPFYLRDLAFLADAINQYEPKYKFFVNQCYWYARTLINVAVDVYRPSITKGQDHVAAGTYTVNKRMKGVRINVTQDCQDEVNDIRKIFEDALKDHDLQVDAKHYKKVGRERYLEQQLAEERKLRRQAEDKLAAAQRGL